MNNKKNILELRHVSKFFGSVIALNDVNIELKEQIPTDEDIKDVNLSVKKGEVHCLLGDNGAGKSTLIKTLAGVHKPSEGEYLYNNKNVMFDSPRDALNAGIATVYQDLALVPLMSVSRNFFMGSEPIKKQWGFIPVYDEELAKKIAKERLGDMGINIRDADQTVGTMSGGERQSLAISRAVYFGAKVLILDEPTAALGVKQSANVLRLIKTVQAKGVSIIFITHNVHHAYPVANTFTLLNRGQSMGTFAKDEVSKDEVLEMMAGGQEIEKLTQDIEVV